METCDSHENKDDENAHTSQILHISGNFKIESKKKYKSQLSYGMYGCRICTPVSSVIASVFTRDVNANSNILDLFTDFKVDEIMEISHKLYEDNFSHTGKNLMFSDVQKYFPRSLFFLDIAGLISGPIIKTNNDKQERDCPKNALSSKYVYEKVDNNLVLIELNDLLLMLFDGVMEDVGKARAALLITCFGHTVCFLYDKVQGLWLFDSLEASLVSLSKTTCVKKVNIAAEYSGLLIFHNIHKPFFEALFA